MRLAAFAAACLLSSIAAADPAPGYRLVADAVLGTSLPAEHPVVATSKVEGPLAACLAKTPATASALIWLELNRSGVVTTAKVHGSGPSALDVCLGAAFTKATATDKLTGPIVVAGHLDLMDVAKPDTFFPSPRLSAVPVMVDPRGATWQVGAKRLAYTANRAADISQALDAQAAAFAACSAARGKKLAASNLLAWSDGKALVRGSGDALYDSCLAKALSSIKLPAPESALWMELELRRPDEPLAPRGTTHEQALREALHDAVKSKKVALDPCFDKQPDAKLGKVTVFLKAGKVGVKALATGVAAVDACVKAKLEALTIKIATPTDTSEVDISFD